MTEPETSEKVKAAKGRTIAKRNRAIDFAAKKLEQLFPEAIAYLERVSKANIKPSNNVAVDLIITPNLDRGYKTAAYKFSNIGQSGKTSACFVSLQAMLALRDKSSLSEELGDAFSMIIQLQNPTMVGLQSITFTQPPHHQHLVSVADDVNRGRRAVQIHWQPGHFTASFAAFKELFFLCGMNWLPKAPAIISMSALYTSIAVPVRTVWQVRVRKQEDNACLVVVCAAMARFCAGMSMQDIARTKDEDKQKMYAHMEKCLLQGHIELFPIASKKPITTKDRATGTVTTTPWRWRSFELYHPSHLLYTTEGTKSWLKPMKQPAANMHTCLHAQTCTHMHTCTHARLRKHTHTNTHTRTHTQPHSPQAATLCHPSAAKAAKDEEAKQVCTFSLATHK